MLEILNLLKLNFKTSIMMMILMTMLVLLNLLKLNFFFSFMQSFGQDDHDIDDDVGVIEFA